MDEKIFELAKELRHELHSHPELSNEESWTKGRLMEFLRKNTNLEIVDRGLWFYAIYRAGEGKKNIAFRADFDAIPVADEIDAPYKSQVPGVGHKCGHDGHAASLAAFAADVDQNGADNNVFFVFQHAEEIGDGAKYAAEVIDEWNIDEIYAFHNGSGMKAGAVNLRNDTICCASKGMEITFTGAPAHAGQPQKGKNPAFAISTIVNAIPGLIDPAEHEGLILCTVIQINVGERAFGCSASKGQLLLTIRAQKEAEMDELQAALERMTKEQCEKYGLEYSFAFYDAFPETANNPECADKVRTACAKLGVPVVEMEEPMRGSEDFGYYLKRTKGALFWLGNGEDYPPLHTVKYDFIDDEIKTIGAIFRELTK